MNKLIKKNILDERQLQIRGNTYYQALSIISTLFLIDFYIYRFFEYNWAAEKWDSLLILFIGITYIMVKLLFYDIYPLHLARYQLTFIIAGIFGVLVYFATLYHILIENVDFICNYQISATGALHIFALFYIVMFIAYLIKLYINKKNLKKEVDNDEME